MEKQNYKKNTEFGSVIFTDSDRYSDRKRVIEKQKKTALIEKDSKKVINSLRNELSELKNLVRELLEQ
jgi:hypothetical protein